MSTGTGEPDSPEARQARALATLVFAVGVTAALHIGKLPVAIPVLREALGVGLVQAGFLLSLVQLAGMMLGLLGGLAADRLGPRRVMQLGLLVLAAGSALGALAPGAGWLLASRAVEGLGFLLAVLPAPGLLRQRVRHAPTLSRALGWWGAYMPLGTALSLLLGASLIGAIGWRGTWLVLAAISLIACAVLTARVPPPAALAVGHAAAALGPRLRKTLAAPGPWLVALAFFLYSGQWLAVIGFLPTIYQQAGFGAGLVGLLTALAAGVNLLGNVAAGRLLARGTAPGCVLQVAYLSMAVGAVVAFAGLGPPWVQYLAVLVFSAVGGLIPGTLFGVAVRLAPDADTVSTTVGWMQQLSSLGQFIGPPLVAWLALRVGGWEWTWVVTGTCSLLGLVVARRLQREWVQVRSV
jgi:MFS family permease